MHPRDLKRETDDEEEGTPEWEAICKQIPDWCFPKNCTVFYGW